MPGSQNDVCIYACAVHLLDTIIIDSTIAGSIFQYPNINININTKFYFEESMSLNRIFQKYSKLLSIFNHNFIFSLNNKYFPKIICISKNNTISCQSNLPSSVFGFPTNFVCFSTRNLGTFGKFWKIIN